MTRVALALAVLVTACTTVPRTEIIVVIDADPGVRVDSDRVRVTVLGGAGTVTGPTAERLNLVVTPGVDGVTWPLRVAVAPLNDDTSRVYSVTASALAPGATESVVGTVRAISGFVPQRTLELHLKLEDACRGVVCDDMHSCAAGACVVANVDPTTLLPSQSDGGATDGAGFDAAFDAPGVPDSAASDAAVDASIGSDSAGFDAALDAPGDAAVLVLDSGASDAGASVGAPRQVAPLSTATVTSRRPLFRWALGSGGDGARVELCRDRACAVVLTTLDATGTSSAPAADLPSGVLFWRLRGRVGAAVGSATSPTWQFTVGTRTAPVVTAWGTALDVNGDGYSDVAVGADLAASGAGRAHIYLGGAGGLATTATTTLVAPDGGQFGHSIASAGDVNGDGFADVVVGARNAAGGGRAYVYLGGAGGLATTPSTTLTSPGSVSLFGHSVAGAGDVNGDGYADVVVGAFGSTSDTGGAYVYLGGPSGLGTGASTTLMGVDAGGHFGASVASTGDVNGDGYADVVVGEPSARSNAGRAYVYLGASTGLSSAATMLNPPGGAPVMYGHSAASAGDVNGDGYADLAVGAGAANGGQAYVYFGGAAGIATVAATTLNGADFPTGHFGWSVSSAGDVNGDGYADLVVGDYEISTDSGAIYVFIGGASGLGTTAARTALSPVVGGFFGTSVAAAGDVNGDGYADVAVGASSGDGSIAGHAYVFVGSATGVAAAPTTTLVSTDGAGGDFGFSVAMLLHRVTSTRAWVSAPESGAPRAGHGRPAPPRAPASRSART